MEAGDQRHPEVSTDVNQPGRPVDQRSRQTRGSDGVQSVKLVPVKLKILHDSLKKRI